MFIGFNMPSLALQDARFFSEGLALIMSVLDPGTNNKGLVPGPSTFEGLILFPGLTCVSLKSFLKAEILLASVTDKLTNTLRAHVIWIRRGRTQMSKLRWVFVSHLTA